MIVCSVISLLLVARIIHALYRVFNQEEEVQHDPISSPGNAAFARN